MKRPGRPMLRVVLLLLAWAAAGAIVNVAVAWGCAMLVPSFLSITDDDLDLELTSSVAAKEWYDRAPKAWRLLPDLGPCDGNILVRRMYASLTLCMNDPHGVKCFRGEPMRTYFISETQSGWPCLSGAYRQCVGDDCNKPFQDELHFGLVVGKPNQFGSYRGECLPLLPIWPGFAINTVFYAVILWGLFTAPLALRKRRRIKRGLCPKCAYDLRGRSPASDSSVCPECGAAVPHAAPIEAKP